MSNAINIVLYLLFLCLIPLHNIASALSTYPTKIKDVVSKLTQVTQTALQNRNSRMEIELPPTAEYGIEPTKNNDLLSMPDKIKKSNREAARLFTDMFSSISSTVTVLFPSEGEASTARSLWTGGAKGALFRGKVLSIDSPAPKGYSNLRSRKFTFEEQQQALLGSDGIYIPEETEVLIITGPRAKDYNKIKRITNKLTDATLVILLNSRSATTAEANSNSDDSIDNTSNDNAPASTNNNKAVASSDNNSNRKKEIDKDNSKSNNNNSDSSNNSNFYKWVNDNYVSVFNYAPPIFPMSDTKSTASVDSTKLSKKEYLLYHEYQNKWYLACKEEKTNNNNNKSNGGGFLEGLTASITGGGSAGFKTLWESSDSDTNKRPSPFDIQTIINSIPSQ